MSKKLFSATNEMNVIAEWIIYESGNFDPRAHNC